MSLLDLIPYGFERSRERWLPESGHQALTAGALRAQQPQTVQDNENYAAFVADYASGEIDLLC